MWLKRSSVVAPIDHLIQQHDNQRGCIRKATLSACLWPFHFLSVLYLFPSSLFDSLGAISYRLFIRPLLLTLV